MKEKRRGGKREAKDRGDRDLGQPRISNEALRGVSAVFLIAVSGFLILASFGVGGTAGATLYEWLSWLLGVGYMLLPLSLVLLAIVILRSFERHFGTIQLASMAVFLFSALGLVDLALPGRGGVLGAAISKPALAAVDSAATVVFLLAFIVAALIVAFDIHLGALFTRWRARIRAVFAKDEAAEPDVPVTGLSVEPETDAAESASQVEVEQEENESAPHERDHIREPHTAPKTDSDGFPIIAATGSTYIPPPVSILAKNKGKPEVGDVKANMNIIKRTLQNFGIQVEMDEASIGPTVTRYAMKPAEGVRLSKIIALQSNLELALAASPVRIEAPIPGKSQVGVEVPNISRTTLGLAPLISDEAYVNSDKPLLVALGRSITGTAHFADLARMPHILVAGTTGA